MSRTLYVSDLDFTLLRSDATLSRRTVEVVNRLIENGGLFTVASARGYRSIARVTADLRLNLPVMAYGAAMVVDPTSGLPSRVEAIPEPAVRAMLDVTSEHPAIEPLLFTVIDGLDRICWRADRPNDYVGSFVDRRVGDPRLLAVESWEVLGPVFYATLIGSEQEMSALYAELEPHLTECFCTLGPDGYRPDQTWLSVTSKHATKGTAVRRLADELGADRVVAFGDNLNDVPLFEAADHSCAVANALPELRTIADEVIGGSDEDGVAEWLARHSG